MNPRLAAIVIVLAGIVRVEAQTIDSLTNKIQTSEISSLDTLKRRPQQTLDSVRTNTVGKLDGMPDSLLSAPQQRLDSVQQVTAGAFNKLKHSYDSITSVSDVMSNRVQQRIDSLANKSLPTDHLTRRLDSIAAWKQEKLSKVNNRVDSLKQWANTKLDSLALPDELKEKASVLTSKIDGLDAALPTNKLPDLSLSKSVPGMDIPGVDIPGLDNPLGANPLGKGSLPDIPAIDGQLPDTSLPNLDLPDTGVGEVTEQVKQVTGAIPGSTEDVPGAVEKQVMKLDQVSGVQGQIGEAEKIKGGLGDTGGIDIKDQEAMKKQVMEKAKKQAVDHFAGKEKQLQEAMEKLAKYKKKYSSVQSIADLPKKRPNEMHGKPLVERLVPGIALQLHRKGDWLVDFNPYLGYRFSGRLTAGIGWNQRVAYNVDLNAFNPDLRIYGPRAFGAYRIGKGFSGWLETEYMNTWVPPRFSSNPNDPNAREWVSSTMAGLKKEYRFIKSVKGTVFILYNLYDPRHRSPYGDRLNMRIGFEFPMKKKKKASAK